jgi:hypothetical protein
MISSSRAINELGQSLQIVHEHGARSNFKNSQKQKRTQFPSCRPTPCTPSQQPARQYVQIHPFVRVAPQCVARSLLEMPSRDEMLGERLVPDRTPLRSCKHIQPFKVTERRQRVELDLPEPASKHGMSCPMPTASFS